VNVEELLKKNKAIAETDIVYPIKKIRLYDSYVMVFLEDEKIQVSDDAYFEYGLKDRKGLDEDLYQKLKEEESVLKAYRGALRKISMKDQSVKQIRDYLAQKEIKRADRERIIEKLKSLSLLDDEKFCISKINYYEKTSLSQKQIREKLKKAGISEELIAKHMRSNETDEYRKALHIAEKYEKSIQNKSFLAKKQSVMNKLVSAGFSYEMSQKATESIVSEGQNELELLQREYQKALGKYQKKYTDHELKEHVIAYLLNKGFRYEDIRSVTEE
jgi:1,2-diacylglycerol 3-alpha-glucosyltransferase